MQFKLGAFGRCRNTETLRDSSAGQEGGTIGVERTAHHTAAGSDTQDRDMKRRWRLVRANRFGGMTSSLQDRRHHCCRVRGHDHATTATQRVTHAALFSPTSFAIPNCTKRSMGRCGFLDSSTRRFAAASLG